MSLEQESPGSRIIAVWAGYPLHAKKSALRFANFSDECFLVSRGQAGIPSRSASAEATSEVALWGYREIRKRHTYWLNKKLLVARIFRSANLSLWQENKRRPSDDPLAAELGVVICSKRTIWVGAVGQVRILLYRETLIDDLLPFPRASQRRLLPLGTARGIPQTRIASESFLPGDLVVVTTGEMLEAIDEEVWRAQLGSGGQTEEDLQTIATSLVGLAEDSGTIGDIGFALVKRLA